MPATRSLNLKAAVNAGLIAGALFLVAEMLLVPLVGGSPWGPPRMIAAIVLGEGVLPPPASFALGIVLVALAVHFALSIVYAIALGAMVHRAGSGAALLIGLAFGLVLYLVNFFVFTAVFPWFATARNWVSIVSHLLFGGVAAASYHALAHRGVRRPVERPRREVELGAHGRA